MSLPHFMRVLAADLLYPRSVRWYNFDMKIRRHYIFTGSVQGVGFRCRAYHAAEHFGVTGWVRNLYDGSVEMEAEGCEEDIDAMLLAIENGHFIQIENMEVTDLPLQGDRSFETR